MFTKRILLAAVVAATPISSASAIDFPRLGIFRKKPAKPDEEAPRAKQLVETVRSDPDEKKRLAAVEELQETDPRTNADVIPTLVTALQRDPSATVRALAAQSIGKLKPITLAAGAALEQTFTADPAAEVRKSAQEALWEYHLNGYRSAGANAGMPQSDEPPLAKSKDAKQTVPTGPLMPTVSKNPKIPAISTASKVSVNPESVEVPPTLRAIPPIARPVSSGIGKGAIYGQTVEPPLAKTKQIATIRPAKPIVVATPIATPASSTPPAGPPLVALPKQTEPRVDFPLPAIPAAPTPKNVAPATVPLVMPSPSAAGPLVVPPPPAPTMIPPPF